MFWREASFGALWLPHQAPPSPSSSSSSAAKRLLPGPVRHGRRRSCSGAEGRWVHSERRRRRRRPCSPSAPDPKTTEYLGERVVPKRLMSDVASQAQKGNWRPRATYTGTITCAPPPFFLSASLIAQQGGKNIVNWQIVQLAHRVQKRQRNSQAAIVTNAL